MKTTLKFSLILISWIIILNIFYHLTNFNKTLIDNTFISTIMSMIELSIPVILIIKISKK